MEANLIPVEHGLPVLNSEVLRFRYCKQKRKTLYAYYQDREFFVDGIRFVIPAGYWFDGATVPRPLWGIFAPGGVAFRAASLHDWLYDTQGEGMEGYSEHKLTRKEVDDLFRKQMLADGTPKVQAWIMWLAVRTPFGKHYWQTDSYPYYLLRLS